MSAPIGRRPTEMKAKRNFRNWMTCRCSRVRRRAARGVVERARSVAAREWRRRRRRRRREGASYNLPVVVVALEPQVEKAEGVAPLREALLMRVPEQPEPQERAADRDQEESEAHGVRPLLWGRIH